MYAILSCHGYDTTGQSLVHLPLKINSQMAPAIIYKTDKACINFQFATAFPVMSRKQMTRVYNPIYQNNGLD